MWWAVVRQAAHDLRYSHDSNALDALDFLRSTGEYVCQHLFDIDPDEYRKEVVGLLMRRNRELGRELSLSRLGPARPTG